MIKLKRVYESSGKDDGKTFLVERLWPRGVKKTALADAIWLKDVAPSTELRKWFGHDPEKWAEFQRRYQAEIKEHELAIEPILQAARHGTVTLLYSSHDTEPTMRSPSGIIWKGSWAPIANRSVASRRRRSAFRPRPDSVRRILFCRHTCSEGIASIL